MNNGPECLPCCLRRVLHTARAVTSDDWLLRKILAESMPELARADEAATPAEVVHSAFRRASKTLGSHDPRAAEKRRWVEETAGNVDRIRQSIIESADPFARAVELAIAANLFDWEFREEIEPGFSLRTLLDDSRSLPLAPSVAENIEDLRSAIDRATRIVFVHDTAAELVFDRLLLEAIGKPRAQVTCVVREVPVFADATREDAEAVGLPEVAGSLIDPGVSCLGLPLALCSKELRDAYEAADVVLAKGQSSYQTLEGDLGAIGGKRKDLFFLLRVKCGLMARHFGVSVGDGVLEPN
jgi:uncharacterized protein with ATP-grasp and redox domains